MILDDNKIVLFDAFEKQQQFIDAAFDPSKTEILYGGAIRGGKTYCALGILILYCIIFPGSRWALVRKDMPRIKLATLPAWEKINPSNSITRFNQQTMTVTFKNGSKIIFFPENYAQDKELNRWKGFEVNGFVFEELNECQEITYNKAIERAGTYIIPGIPKHKQPVPKILSTCNPSFGWVKDKFYTPWEEGTLKSNMMYIPSRIYDNPYLPEDYLNNIKNMGRYEFEVFVNGNWNVQLKTGGEFWKNFELEAVSYTHLTLPTTPYV